MANLSASQIAQTFGLSPQAAAASARQIAALPNNKGAAPAVEPTDRINGVSVRPGVPNAPSVGGGAYGTPPVYSQSTLTGNEKPINLPQQPTADYSNLVNSGFAALNLTKDENGLYKIPQNTQPQTNDLESNVLRMIGMKDAPVQTAPIYAQDRAASGIDTYQQQLNDATTRLNARVTKQQQDLLQVRGVGAKNGVTEAVYGGQQAEINREATIDILGLQGQVAAAQGNLQLAQERFDTMFKLHVEDAKAKVQYNNDLVDSVINFATKEQQQKLDEIKTKNATNLTQLNNSVNFAQELSKNATDNGQANLAAALTKLTPPDPSSKTFDSDLAKYNSGVSAIQSQIKSKTDGQIIGGESTGYYNVIRDARGNVISTERLTGSGGGNEGSGQVDSNILAYAQQYAADGKIPTGLPKGTFGEVARVAKELPKPEGTLVERNTGVKSGSLSSTQEDGISALYDLTKKLDDAKTKFDNLYTGVIPGAIKTVFYTKEQQQYDDLKSEIVDLLARARSGAALTADEVATYTSKLPGRANNSFFLGGKGSTSIEDLKNSIEGKLKTNLATNNLAIYGYSPVKIGDTTYKVGDVISNDGGKTNYRINPDGSLTQI